MLKNTLFSPTVKVLVSVVMLSFTVQLMSCKGKASSSQNSMALTHGDSSRLDNNNGCGLLSSDEINWQALMTEDCYRLSDYNLFLDPQDARNNPRLGGYKYEVSPALFSDYAVKDRFVFIPKNTVIELDSQIPLKKSELGIRYPTGTVITKTFSFKNTEGVYNVIETRLLIKREQRWVALPYVWNDNKTEALLSYEGFPNKDIEVTITHSETVNIKYDVPNTQECQLCHGMRDQLQPIGFSRLNFLVNNDQFSDGSNNLIKRLPLFFYKEKLFDLVSLQRISEDNSLQESSRMNTRQYLDMNCSHCHNPKGYAANSRLYLEAWRPLGRELGLCKKPVAAGRGSGGLPYVINPQNSLQSILWYRLASTENGVKMPELGRVLAHAEGAQQVARWIETMDEAPCAE